MSDEKLYPAPAPWEAIVILKVARGVSVLAAAAVGAVVMVLQFAQAERDRTLRTWQTRLGIIAETRSHAIDGWLSAQFGELEQLSQNQSLQLYMTELVRGRDDTARVTSGLAESGYLRNLLTVVAAGAGFDAPPAAPRVDANVRRLGGGGIALVAKDGRVIVATDGMRPVEGRLRAFLRAAGEGERTLLDMHIDASGTPSMAFSVPVFAIQDRNTREIGRIVGVKDVARELLALLQQPGAVWRTAEAVLVRRNGALIEYLSPTRGGRGPLGRSMAFETARLAAKFAIERPGGFALMNDYRNIDVLTTARRINLAPWALMYKIDRSEALGASEDRLSRQITVLGLIIALVIVTILVVWRHGASQRALRMAGLYGDLARKFEAQSRLLRQVTDNQPSPMFIVDRDGTYRFANRAAALRAGMTDDDMIGKSMTSVIGAAEAGKYERLNRAALDSGSVQRERRREGANGDLRVVQAEHIPIRSDARQSPGIMVVEEDITEAVAERERRERTLEQLIETLLTIVDRRDPHAAEHSIRVASVARAIAEEMALDEVQVGTAEAAGRLMNLGKILVPSDLLTRAGPLDPDEVRRVRQCIESSADLVEAVEFDGPVVETLRQLQENWDGTGSPSGLKGEQILLAARIVMVANAFVAMISPRAWRGAVSLDEATGLLLAQIGKAFERRVVAALINVLDNRGGMDAWADYGEQLPLH